MTSSVLSLHQHACTCSGE